MLTTASKTMTAMLTVSVIRRSTSIEINKKPVDVSFPGGFTQLLRWLTRLDPVQGVVKKSQVGAGAAIKIERASYQVRRARKAEGPRGC
jgi:hypothetical protein